MAANSNRAPGRLDFIEGMRGVAAFYVMLSHVVSMVFPYWIYRGVQEPAPWLKMVLSPLTQGPIAVAAFIVISGFCLQVALFNRGDGRMGCVKGFFARRCRRILPPHYACLAASIGVALTVTQRLYDQSTDKLHLPWSQYLPVTWDNTLAHALMVNNFYAPWRYKINGVLWSIAIEFQLYFLFPLIVWAVWRFGRSWTVAAAAALVYPLVLLAPAFGQFHPWFLTLFALGIAGAHFAMSVERTPERMARLRWVAVLAWVAAFAGCAAFKQIWVRDTCAGIGVTAMLVIGTWSRRSWVGRTFSLPGLVWLGAFSYSLYLMHHPFMQMLYAVRPAWFATPLRQVFYLFVVAVPVIVALCWAFYWVFERPFVSRPALKKEEEPEPVAVGR